MHSNLRSLLLCGVAVAAITAAAPEAAQAQMYSAGPGFYVSAEGRYLMNEGGKVFNFDRGEYPTATTPVVRQRAEDGWGGKLMLGYRFTNNWDVGVGLSGGWLKGKKSDSATTTTTPGFGSGGQTELKVKLDYQVADFEAGYNWRMANSNVRVFGGIRYANFSQKATAETTAFTFTPGGATPTAFYESKRKSTYWGIGPRLGLNGQFGLGNSGFHVFGGVAGAILFGKHKEKQEAAGFTPATTPPFTTASSKRKKSKVVTNLEGELGLGYQFGAGSGSAVALQAGYRAEGFWGAGTKSPTYTDDGRSKRDDYVFHGPFVRLTATFGPAVMAVAAPPPAPPPAAAPKKNFLVFFDFDRSNITADAQRVITEAAAAAKAGNVARIQLTGHTDRSGSDQYNMALSLRRGEAVKQGLIRQGIPAAAITIIGRGESQPLVPTADGVREPQNRRVEILL